MGLLETEGSQEKKGRAASQMWKNKDWYKGDEIMSAWKNVDFIGIVNLGYKS